MKTKKAVLLSILTLLASLPASWAFTWHVDAKGLPGAGGTSSADAFPSLQTAIDRAGNGDLILVAEGTYAPISVASSRSLTIRSKDGAENTFLAGGGKTRCATLANEAGEASWSVTLEGFTLMEGVDASNLGGGGVFGGNLVNCILRDNTAVRGGAARGARLENCLLCDNVAALGGGAFDSELVNCTVVGNRADGTGGGVCECNLANCIVQANDSPDGADAVASVAVRSCTTPLLAGDGNSDADACFVDPNSGDWRLALGSPCLDAGDRGFCTSATDLAGHGRVTGAHVDLGAYEGASEIRLKSKGLSKNTSKMVTIHFFPKGGTCQTNKMTFRVGKKYATLPRPRRQGYVFTGWYTAAQGGTRVLTKTIASASIKKLYAQWAPAVTVSFFPQGGTCQTNKMTFRVGKKYATLPRPRRQGYIFTGWYTAAQGGTRVLTKTIASASIKQLYAQWVPAVTIHFIPNGGTCQTAKMTFRVGKKYATLPRPRRQGYVFTGWYTAAQGGTRVLTKTIASPSIKQLYAQWVPAVTISFFPNKGTCPTKRMTFGAGKKYANLPLPTRKGYIFTGWHTTLQGGTLITSKTIVSTSHKKFYAHWSRLVTVSFDPNGGVCPVSRQTNGIGLPFGSLPTPTRAGFTWTGWYTPEGILVDATSLVTDGRTNLVAHWKKDISVHPVGDSMTYGVRTRHNPLLNGASASAVAQIHNQGWRGYLNKHLGAWGKTENHAIVFLGKHSQSTLPGNVPHDGYCGENASSYARNHEAACSVEADVQIIFLGMNDALAISRKDGNYGSYFGYTQSGYARVLSALHAGTTTPLTILITEPEVTSLVSERSSLYKPGAINHVIAGYINPYVRSQQGPKVKILDIQSLYLNASYTDDGFHLSTEGNKVIADRLADLIEGYREWE